MQLQQSAASCVLSILGTGRTPLFNYRDANTRRQLAHCGRKIDVLVVHHKAEHASADPTSEAVKGLPLWTHMERRGFLLMERAKRLEIGPRAFERKIRADHFDNIVRRGDLLDGL